MATLELFSGGMFGKKITKERFILDFHSGVVQSRDNMDKLKII